MQRRNLVRLFLIEGAAIFLNYLLIQKALAAKWSYTEETGSDFWGEIDPEFVSCKMGEAQSPIEC